MEKLSRNIKSKPDRTKALVSPVASRSDRSGGLVSLGKAIRNYFRSHLLVSAAPACGKPGAHANVDSPRDGLVVQGLIDEVRVLETERVDPESIEACIAVDGYQALTKALSEMPAEGAINVVLRSGLRGRGGQPVIPPFNTPEGDFNLGGAA